MTVRPESSVLRHSTSLYFLSGSSARTAGTAVNVRMSPSAALTTPPSTGTPSQSTCAPSSGSAPTTMVRSALRNFATRCLSTSAGNTYTGDFETSMPSWNQPTNA